MNRITPILAALILAAGFAGTAHSQQHHDHGGGTMKMDGMKMDGASADSPATKAFKQANARMHKDMDITYSGDADADFVRGMIPHHQGAIDMAKVMLAHGKDPELRKLASAIIADQEKEIAQMQDWLKKNGK